MEGIFIPFTSFVLFIKSNKWKKKISFFSIYSAVRLFSLSSISAPFRAQFYFSFFPPICAELRSSLFSLSLALIEVLFCSDECSIKFFICLALLFLSPRVHSFFLFILFRPRSSSILVCFFHPLFARETKTSPRTRWSCRCARGAVHIVRYI